MKKPQLFRLRIGVAEDHAKVSIERNLDARIKLAILSPRDDPVESE